jgi:hypothetical protein
VFNCSFSIMRERTVLTVRSQTFNCTAICLLSRCLTTP